MLPTETKGLKKDSHCNSVPENERKQSDADCHLSLSGVSAEENENTAKETDKKKLRNIPVIMKL